jgi:hypothetical protein
VFSPLEGTVVRWSSTLLLKRVVLLEGRPRHRRREVLWRKVNVMLIDLNLKTSCKISDFHILVRRFSHKRFPRLHA